MDSDAHAGRRPTPSSYPPMASAFDPTRLGLPAGFRMTNYSKLKG